jgi:DedD protein
VVDKGLMQRIVGALVLVALAVIFVPMLFNRDDAVAPVQVDAPQMPDAPASPVIETQPVAVPEPDQKPEPEPPEQFDIVEEAPAAQPELPDTPITPAPEAMQPSETVAAPAVQPPPVAPTAPAAAEEKRLDAANLPVSWSVQLASLSSRDNAEKLQKTLRSQGYNAYVRTAEGMNRVFVGPLVERNEADRLRDQLQRQHKLNGFVVRFKPEQG